MNALNLKRTIRGNRVFNSCRIALPMLAIVSFVTMQATAQTAAQRPEQLRGVDQAQDAAQAQSNVQRINAMRFPAGIVAKGQLPTERTLNYEFNGVSIDTVERWLRVARVTLPVEVSGDVSGWVWAQRSARGLFDFANYWLEGELSSPKLVIDKWTVDAAKWRFGFRNGTWYVGSLRGAVTPPDQSSAAGAVELAGMLPTTSGAVLSLTGDVNQVDLASLLKGFAVDVPIANRGGSLKIDASVPFDHYRDLKYWSANASLQLDRVAVPRLRDPVLVTARAGLNDGRWALNDALFSLQNDEDRAASKLPLRVTADGPLESPWPFSVRVSSAAMELSELLRQFDLQPLAEQVTGSATVAATAGGDADRGVQSAELNVRSEELSIQDQPVRGVSLTGKLVGETASARFQLASVLNGTAIGTANWNDLRKTQTGEPNRISLSLDGINLDAIRIPALANRLSGIATGRVEFQSETNEGKATWSSSGDLNVANAGVRFLASNAAPQTTALGDVSLNWSKAADANSGNVSLNVAQGNSRIAATVNAELDDRLPTADLLSHVQRYNAEGSVTNYATNFPLASLSASLPAQNESAQVLPVQVTANFQSSGSKENWIERGSAQVQSLRTEYLGRAITVSDAIAEASPEEFRVRQFTIDDSAANDSAGRILGAGILRRNGDGENLVRLAVSNVSLASYWNTFAPQQYAGVDGRITTQFEFTIPAKQTTSFTDLQALGRYGRGEFSGAVRGLSFQETSIGDIDFRGDLEDGKLNLNADGEVLEGTAELTLEVNDLIDELNTMLNAQANAPQAPANQPAAQQPSSLDTSFDVRLNSVQLEPLLALVNLTTRPNAARSESLLPKPAQGGASLSFNARVVAGQIAEARGQLSVPRFIYDREPLAQELFIDAEFANSQFTIRRASGKIAGGMVNASGSIALPVDEASAVDGELLFTIQEVDAGQLATFLYPSGADQFAGRVSYRGRGRFGRNLTFVGAATTSNAMLYGFPLQSVRGSVQFDFDRGGNFKNFSASNLVGTGLGGQLNADVRIRGGATYDLQADGRLRRGKMEQLSRALGFDRIVGSGNFNSAFQFNSRDAFQIGALNGRLQLDFDEGDAQSVPILSDLNRLVPLMQLASTDITSGRLDARIGQGLLQIENLLLNSEAFWIAGNGNASLRTGNLNLQGVLQTGGGLEAQVSQASLRRLATLLLPEVVFVAELDNLLRNRTLYFRVRGSTNRPVIQPKIAPSIARGLLQEVKRSLLASSRIIAVSDD